MAQQQGKFRTTSMGCNTDNPFFSALPGTGFKLSSYAGRLQLKFWKAGENSGENRDNQISLNIQQSYLLAKIISFIKTTRTTQFMAGGADGYLDLPGPLFLNLEGKANGEMTNFGTILFGTTDIDGVKRVTMTVTKGTTSNIVVFADGYIKTALGDESPLATVTDIMEISFNRFVKEVEEYTGFSSWMQAAFNKLFGTITNRGGNGGGNGGGYNNGGGNGGGGYNNGGGGYGGGSQRVGGDAFDKDSESPIFKREDSTY